MGLKDIRAAVPLGIVGCLWLLGWTALTLFFDAVGCHSALSQLATSAYVSTEGRIMSLRSEDCGGETTFEIQYSYTVDDRAYEGTRYRLGSGSYAGSTIEASVSNLRVGQDVTVYYDPAQPGEAVLRRGLQSEDLHLFLFMTPFNMVMLGGWGMVVAAVKRRRSAEWPCQRDGSVTRVRVVGVSPWLAAAMVLGGFAFVLTFALAIPFDSNPPWNLTITAWMGILTAAVVTYLVIAGRRRRGQYDLVIDAESVLLPAGCGRSMPRRIKRADIVEVGMRTLPQRKAALLCWRASEGRLEVERMLEDRSEEETKRFVVWLRTELGLPPRQGEQGST